MGRGPKEPSHINRTRCPECFRFGAEPMMRQVWDRSAHMYRDEPEYVMPNCPTCHGEGSIMLGRPTPKPADP